MPFLTSNIGLHHLNGQKKSLANKLNILEYIERHKIAILITAFIHMILLVWFNVQVIIHKPYKARERVVMQLDFSDDQKVPTPPEEPESNDNGQKTPLTNAVQNASQEKTSYTNENFSRSKAEQEVWEELKAMEQAEFNSLKKEEDVEEDNKENHQEEIKIDKNLVKEGAEQNNKAEYGMDIKATATYFLENRSPQRKPTPSYKCTSEGVVTVKIKVNQKGIVVASSIDEEKTNTSNNCLRNEALKYAKRWKFTQNFNAPLRKEGWIRFSYVAQ